MLRSLRPSSRIVSAGAIGFVFLVLGPPLPAQREPDTRAPSAQAAEPSQAEFVKLRDEKKTLPAFRAAPWLFDYDAALAEAKRTDRPVFLYLTRSYRPSPLAKSLEQGTFLEPAFARFARQVVLCCAITSQVRGDPHQDLLQRMGLTIHPAVAIVDGDGRRLARHHGERTLASFERLLAACLDCRALERRFLGGEKDLAHDLLVKQLELEQVELEAARARRTELGTLDAERARRLDELLLNLEVETTFAPAKLVSEVVEVGRRFETMRQAGRMPTGRAALDFCAAILEAKDADGDAAGFAEILEIYRKLVGDSGGARRVIARFEDRLERLQKAAQKPDGKDKQPR